MSEPEGLEHVEDHDLLLRRIPDQPEAMWTRKGGVLRPSSAALKPSQIDRGLSVDVRRLLEDPGAPTSVLSDHPSDGLIEFEAREPRRAGLDVQHAPLPGRYSHADVVGFEWLSKPAAQRLRRELAKRAAWVRQPASAAA
jgi:hypothetical protein